MTTETISDFIDYDSETGKLTWKKVPSNAVKLFSEARARQLHKEYSPDV